MSTMRVKLEGSLTDLPLALAHLHRRLAVGDTVHIEHVTNDVDPAAPSRRMLMLGGGFDATRARNTYRRMRTLPDYLGPRMRIMLVGLNPSWYSADAGVGFARPGNRFWPSMLAAGLVDRDRDPRRTLVRHRIGMTDLVKRPSARAEELDADEFRRGYERVHALVRWLRPSVVCFVGLSGWRVAVDRRAVAGLQPEPIGSTAVYVMPNPSGLNAHSTVATLADHLRAVDDIARRRARAARPRRVTNARQRTGASARTASATSMPPKPITNSAGVVTPAST
jgi:TDG/mug DNA glycosylase family protein